MHPGRSSALATNSSVARAPACIQACQPSNVLRSSPIPVPRASRQHDIRRQHIHTFRAPIRFGFRLVPAAARNTRCHAQQRKPQPADPAPDPDFDQLKLDDAYYQEMGIDEDELDAQTTYNADDIDPEGEQGKLEDLYQPQEGTPQFLLDELYNADVWGPEAVLLAGFRAEEIVMVRVILDSAGGEAVKVVPCMGPMLYETVEVALQSPEPEWNEPRPEQWTRGGAWGAQRVILFSGMKLAAQAALVELLEGSGLPPVCIAVATQDLADTVLGEVLAAAVKEQRGRKNPKKEVWDNERMSAELPDIKDMVGDRLKDIQAKFDEGKLEDIFEDPGHGPEFTVTLDDIQRARGLKANEARAKQAATTQPAEFSDSVSAAEQANTQQHTPVQAADRTPERSFVRAGAEAAGQRPLSEMPHQAADAASSSVAGSSRPAPAAASGSQPGAPATSMRATGTADSVTSQPRAAATGTPANSGHGSEASEAPASRAVAQHARAMPSASSTSAAPSTSGPAPSAPAGQPIPSTAAAAAKPRAAPGVPQQRVSAATPTPPSTAATGPDRETIGPETSGAAAEEPLTETEREEYRRFMADIQQNIASPRPSQAELAALRKRSQPDYRNVIDAIVSGEVVDPATAAANVSFDSRTASSLRPPAVGSTPSTSATTPRPSLQPPQQQTTPSSSSSQTAPANASSGDSSGFASDWAPETSGTTPAGAAAGFEVHINAGAPAEGEADVWKKLNPSLDPKLQAELRGQALQPTEDAIKAALTCGLRPEELKAIIDREMARMQATNEAPFESSGVMQTIRSPGGGMSVDDVMAQAEQPPTAADRARNGTGSAGSTTSGASTLGRSNRAVPKPPGLEPRSAANQAAARPRPAPSASPAARAQQQPSPSASPSRTAGQGTSGTSSARITPIDSRVSQGQRSPPGQQPASTLSRMLAAQQAGQAQRPGAAGSSPAGKRFPGTAPAFPGFPDAGESPNRRWPFKAAAKPGVSPVDKRFGAAASVASQAQSEGSAVLPAPAYGMPPGGTRPATMTRAELQAFAERSGRSFEALLADAQAKGVRLAEE